MCIRNEEFCIKNDEFCRFTRGNEPMYGAVSKTDEFCIKNEELCIENKELCI